MLGFHGEISVTYSNGVFKPDQRLNVPEGSRFRAMIRPAGSTSAAAPNPADARKAMDEIRRISESGAFNSGGEKLTRDQMHERR